MLYKVMFISCQKWYQKTVETGFNNTSHPYNFLELIWELQKDAEFSCLQWE